MSNLTSYILANTYSGFSPTLNLASIACTVNGQQVACPSWFGGAALVFGAALVLLKLFLLALAVLIVVGVWKMYVKAGQPGWAAIVPVYNVVVMLQIVGKPVWWVILYFIPFVNIVMAIVVANALARAFGKGIGYTIGLIFLPFIFYPILGLGKAVYQKPV